VQANRTTTTLPFLVMGVNFGFFCLGKKKFLFLVWGKRKEGVFGNRPIRCVDRQMDRKQQIANSKFGGWLMKVCQCLTSMWVAGGGEAAAPHAAFWEPLATAHTSWRMGANSFGFLALVAHKVRRNPILACQQTRQTQSVS
jgi:hypothetical protein